MFRQLVLYIEINNVDVKAKEFLLLSNAFVVICYSIFYIFVDLINKYLKFSFLY